MPAGENRYGHVSLETSRYYLSVWPRGDIKERGESVQAATTGVDADVVYHRDLDYYLESKRTPEIIALDQIPDKDVNSLLEDFLRYNDINPADVTLEAAERKIEAFLRTENVDDWPVKKLSKTRYRYVGKGLHQLGDFWHEDAVQRNAAIDAWARLGKFYWNPQSCTSFVLNVIEGVVDASQRQLWATVTPKERARIVMLTVENFREILDEYYIQKPKTNDGCVIF